MLHLSLFYSDGTQIALRANEFPFDLLNFGRLVAEPFAECGKKAGFSLISCLGRSELSLEGGELGSLVSDGRLDINPLCSRVF